MTNLIYVILITHKECIADMNVSIGSFKTGKTFLSITTNDFIPPAPNYFNSPFDTKCKNLISYHFPKAKLTGW